MTEHVYFVYSVTGSKQTVRAPFLKGAGAPAQYGPRFESLLIDRERKQIIGNTLANDLLDPAPHKGWEQYYL